MNGETRRRAGRDDGYLRTPQLGLAAFLDMHGFKLAHLDRHVFVFERGDDTRTIEQWEIEYSSSEAARHDAALVKLRKLRPERRRGRERRT